MGSDSSSEDQKLPPVFISHSATDVEFVRHIVQGLNSEGIDTWCSTLDQRPSTRRFADVIIEKLAMSPMVLGILSNKAIDSDWVLGELKRAREAKKLMLVKIEQLSGSLDPAYDQLHFADLSAEPLPLSSQNWSDFVEAVRDDLRRLLESKPSAVLFGDQDSSDPASSETEGTTERPDKASFSAKDRQDEDIGSLLENSSPSPDKAAGSDKPALLPKPGSLSEKPLARQAQPLDLGIEARDWCLLNPRSLIDKGFARQDPLAIHKAARAGQGDAQALIGFAHMLGIAPFDHDEASAGRWLERASNVGEPRAKAELAVLIASGRFGTFDLARIDRLSAEAVDGDCPRGKTYRALLRLTGTRLPNFTPDDSLALLEAAHRQGDWLASTHLGWSLLRGRGTRRNVKRGFALLQDAAYANEARACSYLGIAYGEGRGVRRDPDKATHWFKRGASGGDLLGLFQYAWCHEMGYGTARDAAEARRLYRQAAERGEERAMVRLAMMMLEARGGVANPGEAVKLLQLASDLDDSDAKSLLGELYLEGRGVARDVDKAVALLTTAADRDQAWALWTLGKLYEDGIGVPRDRERAISLFRRAAFNATTAELFQKVLKRLDNMGAQVRLPDN